VKLSLLVTYRQRESHLKTQLAWFKSQQAAIECEVILIEADEYHSAWIAAEIANTNIKYVYLPCSGAFHKTKALNLGLSLASGEFVAPFDVDLIPLSNTLSQHLKIAQLSPQLLVTGYRVMLGSDTINSDAVNNTKIAPEDQPTALWKQLVQQERFGVVPLFQRDRLLEIGGWDEKFVGWGGEDQDIIERYLQDGRFLSRCPELVYLHLPHPPNQHWTETAFVDQNRQHYYTSMKSRCQGN
jgi:predicted glycosyltransferase involved in capsule biosynthesis